MTRVRGRSLSLASHPKRRFSRVAVPVLPRSRGLCRPSRRPTPGRSFSMTFPRFPYAPRERRHSRILIRWPRQQPPASSSTVESRIRASSTQASSIPAKTTPLTLMRSPQQMRASAQTHCREREQKASFTQTKRRAHLFSLASCPTRTLRRVREPQQCRCQGRRARAMSLVETESSRTKLSAKSRSVRPAQRRLRIQGVDLRVSLWPGPALSFWFPPDSGGRTHTAAAATPTQSRHATVSASHGRGG
jgi:hypothetical protein